MARIFLSHSSKDNDSAKVLDAWLADNGWSDVFIDLDPKRGLSPGERWQDELRKAADRCEAVILLVSPAWLDSKWCLAEFMLARNLHKKIFGVLISPVDFDDLPAEMTAEWELCDLTGGSSSVGAFNAIGIERLKVGLEKAGLDARTFPWPPRGDSNRSPYRGLRPLEADDAAVFFGREAQIVAGLDQLRRLRDERFKGIVVIVGASGAGKSSFLRAGLIPRLRRDDRNFLVLVPVRPQTAAVKGPSGLAWSLHKLTQRVGLTRNLSAIEDQLTRPDGLANILRDAREATQDRITIATNERLQPLTVIFPIDQAEELFENENRPESKLLLDNLAYALGGQARVQLLTVLTIRSDCHEFLQQESKLQGIPRHLIDLPPMPVTQFKDIVIGPAERLTEAGTRLEVEPRLVDALLKDARGADALPILAFTLEQLYRKYGSDGTLELHEYRELTTKDGGVISAVIDEALKHPDIEPRIPSDDQELQMLLREVFSGLLVSIDPDSGRAVRRQVEITNVPEHLKPLVARLTEARLLSKDLRDGVETFEIAHDSVLESWQPLRDWIEDDRAFLIALDRIEKAQHDWQQSGEDDSVLMPTGSRLAEAEEWIKKEPKRTEHVRNYVLRSTNCAKKAIRSLRNQRLVASTLAVVAAIAAAAAILFGIDANRAKQQADQNAQLALARQLAAQAQLEPNSLFGVTQSALLAVESLRRAETPSGFLARAVAANRPVPSIRFAHDDLVVAAVFTADGTRIATASKDNTVRIWDAQSGEELQRLTVDGWVGVSAFTADGKRFAAPSWDHTVRIWDTKSGQELQRLAHDDEAVAVAFTPDGKRIATASADKTARIWDAQSGDQLQRFTHDGWVRAVAITADGMRIATTSNEEVRIWDTQSGEELRLVRHDDNVLAISFTPDGTRIATASLDNTARIWDTENGEELQRLAHDDWVVAVAFTPDGTRIATASNNETARIWNSESGKELQRLTHNGWVRAIAFTPDGTRIATASMDHVARIWNTQTNKEPKRLTHDGWVEAVAFTPNGTRIATASKDRTARIWDSQTGEELQRLSHDGAVVAVMFTADGTRIVSASLDGTVRIWDSQSGQELQRLTHDIWVGAAAVTADGSRIATSSQDNITRIWDTQTGEVSRRLPSDGSPNTVALTANGTYIATASKDNTVRIWDTQSGKELQRVRHDGIVRAVAFTADGTRIATASNDRTARIWDSRSGRELQRLTHDFSVEGIAVTTDGARIATASNNTVRIWDIQSGEELQRLTHNSVVEAVAFTTDGARIGTGSWDDTARIWRLNAQELIDELCGRLSRNLTCSEWRRHLGEETYRATCPNLPAQPVCP